ncbi:MAG TPA: cyclic nucleotide-binding domain-containing protein, partial [Solirubrobacteraceae bacterium]|nr:cyclic nucleotide-binding domain-containing protein [Solirubrobacteraceae bacterium]
MKTIVPLRMVAICSNIAFITYALLGLKYGVFGRVYPILVLHASLLPLNLVRLRQLKELQRSVREASEDETVRSLVPYMDAETHAAGEFLFRRGDPANRLYVIQHGHVRFPEIGKVVSDGQVFGEVGLFAPH